MTDGYSIGIDLGTTNCVVAHASAGGVSVLPNDNGDRTTPAVVSFAEEGVLVGRRAVNQAVRYSDRTVFSVKRKMGEADYRFDAGGETYRAEEISALILRRLVADAEATLGGPVSDAVITVPAYFNHRQREATKQAAEIAGIEVDRLLNEPTAACLAHGLDATDERLVFVYDLGGGTFDASLVRVDDGLFEVVATDGLNDVGGDDWDRKIVAGLVSHVRDETGADLRENPQAMQRVWEAAQSAKHELSSRTSTVVLLPYLLEDANYTLEKRLTRDQFDEMTAPLLSRTTDVCADLLREAGVDRRSVDEVVLVGGSTRMLQVPGAIESLFGRSPSKGTNPDEIVAVGAATQSAVMGDTLPVRPDADSEVEAAGDAADDASGVPAVSGGGDAEAPARYDDVVLLDVTAKTLGIRGHYGENSDHFFRHIPRNSSIPATADDTYRTIRDNQTAVEVPVYQGESDVASENEYLGEFVIRGLPPAPAGEMEIEVRFELDRDGILTVTGEDVQNGTVESITVESEVALTESEIESARERLPEVR